MFKKILILLSLVWASPVLASGSIYCDGGTNCKLISSATHATPTNITLPSGTASLVTPPLTPGGRLSLIANAIMSYDVVGGTTVYYEDFNNDLVPVYNGTNWIEYPISGGISLALDDNTGHTGYQASGSMYDLFVYNNAGAITLCTGPAWTNTTTRSSYITFLNGILVNGLTITLKCDNTSATYSATANQATLVGTMFVPSAATTLNGAIATTGATSMTPTSACGTGGTGTYCFPYAANFYIKIDSEVMQVTAGQGTTTWTITRGARGTTAATHTTSTAVAMDGGQTNFQMKPTAVAGGSNPQLLITNMYNRLPVTSFDSDATTSWTYTTGAYRASDNSNANRVTFIDPTGVNQSNIKFYLGIGSTTSTGYAGPGYNTNSTITGTLVNNTSLTNAAYAAALDTQPPTTGLQYFQGVEYGATGVTYYAGGYNGFRLQLDTFY